MTEVDKKNTDTHDWDSVISPNLKDQSLQHDVVDVCCV